MIRDVLVFTPVLRLEPATIGALMSLDTPEGVAVSLLLQRDNPHGSDGYANHLHQYRRARRHFLAGEYDHMLIIESDIIPPPDTLTRLEACNADLAYGAYVFRPSGQSVNILCRYPQPAKNIGEPLTAHGLKQWREAQARGIVDCSGSGFGCLLIRRHVIEKIDFRLDGNGYCDGYFTDDVYAAGYTMRADCNLTCGHIHTDGTVLNVP